jgi:hypothetical protein
MRTGRFSRARPHSQQRESATSVKAAGSDSNSSGGPIKNNRSRSQGRYGRRPVRPGAGILTAARLPAWYAAGRDARARRRFPFPGSDAIESAGLIRGSVQLGRQRLLETASLAARRLIRSRSMEQRADQSSDVAVDGGRNSRGSASERPPAALGHAGGRVRDRAGGSAQAAKMTASLTELAMIGSRTYSAAIARRSFFNIVRRWCSIVRFPSGRFGATPQALRQRMKISARSMRVGGENRDRTGRRAGARPLRSVPCIMERFRLECRGSLHIVEFQSEHYHIRSQTARMPFKHPEVS